MCAFVRVCACVRAQGRAVTRLPRVRNIKKSHVFVRCGKSPRRRRRRFGFAPRESARGGCTDKATAAEERKSEREREKKFLLFFSVFFFVLFFTLFSRTRNILIETRFSCPLTPLDPSPPPRLILIIRNVGFIRVIHVLYGVRYDFFFYLPDLKNICFVRVCTIVFFSHRSANGNRRIFFGFFFCYYCYCFLISTR